MKTMSCKGYTGSVDFSEEDLINDFHGAVDDYLEHQKEISEVPEVPNKGSFNIRKHRKFIAWLRYTQWSMGKH